LDPNINSLTTFISSELSGIEGADTLLHSQSNILESVKEISAKSKYKDMDDWINQHKYWIEIFSKFRFERTALLKKIASQVVDKYNTDDCDYFIRLTSAASQNVENGFVVLSDSDEHQKLYSQLKRFLPVNFRVDVSPDSSHFDLVNNIGVSQRYLKEL